MTSTDGQGGPAGPESGAAGYARLAIAMRQSLRGLGAPASEQAAYLRTIGASPRADELKLKLDDVALLTEFLGEQLITPDQGKAVKAVLDKLAEMKAMQGEALWDEGALATRAEWQEVRRLAAAALAQLGEH